MYSRVIVVILVLVVAGPAVTASAQSVGVFANQEGWDPLIVDAPGLVSIYAVVHNAPGVTALQFSAPLPNCFTGSTYLSDTTPFPVTIGNSQSGVAVGFGMCLTSPIHVLTINVFAQGLTSPDSCCWYPVLPDPSVPSGEIEFVDCNNNLVFDNGGWSIISADGFNAPWVGDPSPLDGAVDQAFDTQLSWNIRICSIGLGTTWSDVFFGTTTDPPQVASFLPQNEHDPGPLDPLTTYYWKVRVTDSDAQASTMSPLWSFTTRAAVPTEHSTWGQIKALYRD